MRKYNKDMNTLKEKRKELGLTQIQAARLCGVSRRTYQTYEENNSFNSGYEELVNKLQEIGILDGSNYVCSINQIKQACKEVFQKEYKEVECAYLYGSYARGEADGRSDIDIIVVCPPIGMKFYGIATDLEEKLHKQIDLHTHRQLVKEEKYLKVVLKEGIKIFG